MLTAEHVLQRLLEALPGVQVRLLTNGSPSGQHSLLLDREDAVRIARFLRDDPDLRLDYLSNVTGIDQPVRTIQEKRPAAPGTEGGESTGTETVTREEPGYLEAVYHLYSIALRHGPVVVRMRTADRDSDTHLPSLTSVWKSAEFQEREIFDLYGIRFDGHPDLRRLLMWDEFEGHPMRKDYVAPDDYEYEPTPHDAVHERARAHYPGPETPLP